MCSVSAVSLQSENGSAGQPAVPGSLSAFMRYLLYGRPQQHGSVQCVGGFEDLAGEHATDIDRVERALEGCRAGDTIEVEVPPSEGFGEFDPDLTFTDDLENVPPQFQRVGAQVEMANEAGETKMFVVSKIALLGFLIACSIISGRYSNPILSNLR